jgi:hypothetical protein
MDYSLERKALLRCTFRSVKVTTSASPSYSATLHCICVANRNVKVFCTSLKCGTVDGGSKGLPEMVSAANHIIVRSS